MGGTWVRLRLRGVTVLSDLRVLSRGGPQDRGGGAFALLSRATWAVDQAQDQSCPSDTAESAWKLSCSTSGEAVVAAVRTQGEAATQRPASRMLYGSSALTPQESHRWSRSLGNSVASSSGHLPAHRHPPLAEGHPPSSE